jgi:hypothetical protein
MQVFDLVSKLFPELCHVCSNSCRCQVFGTSSVATSSKNKKRKVEDDSDKMSSLFGYGKSSSKGSKTEPKTGSKAARLDVGATIFAQFVEEDDPELMDMDGIGKFCEALNIDATTDVKALVLMWRLGAGSKPGCITKTEFCNGFAEIGANSMDGLVSKCPSFDPGFLETKEFRGNVVALSCGDLMSVSRCDVSIFLPLIITVEFYKFVFQFNREGTNKTIGKFLMCGCALA